MSRFDITTQDLFRQIGTTSLSRKARADAVFRRLRLEADDQIAEALLRAPAMLDTQSLDLDAEQENAE